MVISSLYVLIPLINQLANIFHSTVYLTASVNSVFSIFYAIGFLYFGPLYEKYGKKQTIVLGMFLLSIITLIAGFSTSLKFLTMCRAFQGFVAASFAPAAFAYIFECFSDSKRMITMTWVTTGFLAAGIIGQIMSSLLVQFFSWRYVFWIFALIYIILCFANWQVLISTSTGKKTEYEGIGIVITRLSKNNSLIKAYITAFTLLLSYVALYSAIGDYLTTVLLFSPSEIFNSRAIGIVGIIIGSLLVRPMTNRYKFSNVVALGITIMIISVIVPIVIPTMGGVLFSLICFVGGISVTIPCLISLVGLLAGRDSSLAVTGYTFVIFVGASIGPLIANVGKFRFIALLLVCILCIALGMTLRINEDAAKHIITD